MIRKTLGKSLEVSEWWPFVCHGAALPVRKRYHVERDQSLLTKGFVPEITFFILLSSTLHSFSFSDILSVVNLTIMWQIWAICILLVNVKILLERTLPQIIHKLALDWNKKP